MYDGVIVTWLRDNPRTLLRAEFYSNSYEGIHNDELRNYTYSHLFGYSAQKFGVAAIASIYSTPAHLLLFARTCHRSV